MRCACFDITGTLLHHDTLRPLPLMPELLQSLRREGWQLKVITTWHKTAADSLLRQGNLIPFPIDSIDIWSASDKAHAVRQLLTPNVKELVFIDDKPKHIEAVKRIHDHRVQAIGIFGSGDHAPEARPACLHAGAGYALTAVDLAEQLNALLSHDFRDLEHLTVDELIDLVPGLQCPGSSLAGETHSFDHRMVPGLLFRRSDEWRHDEAAASRLWQNLAWVNCDQCAFKLMARLAVAQIGADCDEVLGKAYKADEYVEAILKNPDEIRFQLYKRMRAGLGLMHDGLHRIHKASWGRELAAFLESKEHTRLKQNRNRFRWAFGYDPNGPIPNLE